MPKIPSPHQKLTQKQSDNILQQNRQEDRDNKYGYQLQMQQNYRQNLQRNSHYDQNQVIKDQFRTQIENFKNSLGKNNLNQQINSDYQNINKYDDMRNLTKIRSQETIKVINNFDKVPKSSQRKIQTNRNPEKYDPNKDQITSVRSLDRLDRLKNTAISAGNTSRTAKHNNWMRILKQQQLKYNQVKEKIQY